MTHPTAIAASRLVAAYPEAQRAIMDTWLRGPDEADFDALGDMERGTLELTLLRMAGYDLGDEEARASYLAAIRTGVLHRDEIARGKGLDWRMP